MASSARPSRRGSRFSTCCAIPTARSGAARQIFAMSLFLEALVIATPIAFQLVLDEVIVLNDHDLLVIVALGLGLVLAFRALVDFVRSWSIMSAGATLTLQWKMTLFRHLLHLPLSFFERRHVGDVASRFGSIDTIQKTLSTAAISRDGRWPDVARAGRHDVALQPAARGTGHRRDADLRRHPHDRLSPVPPRQ